MSSKSSTFLGNNAPNFKRNIDGWDNLTTTKNVAKRTGDKLRKKDDDYLEDASEENFEVAKKLKDAEEFMYGDDN